MRRLTVSDRKARRERRRILLAIFAGICALMLAVGGAFMLYNSEPAATNIVTVGDLDIMLEETGGEHPNEALISDNIAQSNNFGLIEPGQTIDKEPVITHVRGTYGYARVLAEFKITNLTNGDDVPKEYLDMITAVPGNTELESLTASQLLAHILSDATLDPCWVYVPKDAYSCYFYYVQQTDPAKLALLPTDPSPDPDRPTSTTPVFTQLTMPNYNISKDFDWGINFELRLTAQVIQSKNTPGDPDDPAGWARVFADMP
jgi:hypothetical protein